jgi:hypothetical protein
VCQRLSQPNGLRVSLLQYTGHGATAGVQIKQAGMTIHQLIDPNGDPGLGSEDLALAAS